MIGTKPERQLVDSVQVIPTDARRTTAAFEHDAYSMRRDPVLHGRLARDAVIMASVGRSKQRFSVELHTDDRGSIPSESRHLCLYARRYQLIACYGPRSTIVCGSYGPSF